MRVGPSGVTSVPGVCVGVRAWVCVVSPAPEVWGVEYLSPCRWGRGCLCAGPGQPPGPAALPAVGLAGAVRRCVVCGA